MSKFTDALQRGKALHENAERAKNEIAAVFTGLRQEVLHATGGKVALVRGQLSRSKLFGTSKQDSPIAWLSQAGSYDALYIDDVGGVQLEELCAVKTTPSGYPVTLEFPGFSASADGRVALEDALVELLEHPDIAGKITRTVDVSRQQEAERARSVQGALTPSVDDIDPSGSESPSTDKE